MSENFFYFLSVCEKNGSKGLQYSKDSFSSKLFPSLNENQKPRDFKNSMKVYEEVPKGFERQLDFKNVDTEKLTRLLKKRVPLTSVHNSRLDSSFTVPISGLFRTYPTPIPRVIKLKTNP